MSDTPRTDVLLIAHDMAPTHISLISHARELERELNEWKRWCKEKEQALDDLAKVFSQQQDRIKRLEEESESRWLLAQSAVESCAEMSSRIKRLEEAGDKIVEAGWSVQDWSGMCVVWAKAKEAKP